jgi:hypothetical protein
LLCAKARRSKPRTFFDWRILGKVCSSGGSLEISVKKPSAHVENEDAAEGPHLRFDYLAKLVSFQRGFCFTVKVFPAISIVPTRARLVLLTDTE